VRTKAGVIVAAALVLAGLFGSGAPWLSAQSAGAALTGVVTSQEEGKMEGVLVTARRDGANFSISVVSNEQGQYRFPRSHVGAGRYTLTMRATGYDLIDPGPVNVVDGKTAMLDLKLRTTADLSKQLSTREWAMSLPPGPGNIRDRLLMARLSCAYCHSIERILRSKYSAEEFVAPLTRMLKYFGDGSAVPSGTGRARAALQEKAGQEAAEKSPYWSAPRADGSDGVSKIDVGNYFASVNLSGGRTTWPFALKTLPRPTGKATRVIVTTWDIPRKDAVAHDSEVDSKGNVWYNEENALVVGKLDPRTNTFTEYPLAPVDQSVPGSRDIMIDPKDNVWLPLRGREDRSVLYKFEPSTQKLTMIEGTLGAGTFGAVQPDGSHVWLGFVRVDARTGRVVGDFRQPPNLAPGQRSVAYGFAINSKGNPYGLDFAGSQIYGVDIAKNEGKFWPTLRPNVYPRRGRIDAQDRFWFGEYGGDAIGMFDTRTGKMSEWKVPLKFTTPYTATVPDARGYVYAPSNTSERLLRLDPKTGEVVEYPMPGGPGNFDTKKISLDPTTKRTVILFANTRNAQIMRVEPLD
jgi:virginiamycin B lyase